MTATQFTVQQPVCNACLQLKVMIPQWNMTHSQMKSRFWKTSVSAIMSSFLVLVSTFLVLLLSFYTHLIPRQLACTQTVRATIYRNTTSVNTGSSSWKNTNELVPLLSTIEHMVNLRYQSNYLAAIPIKLFCLHSNGRRFLWWGVCFSVIHWDEKKKIASWYLRGKELIYFISTADANQANSLTYKNLITYILSK